MDSGRFWSRRKQSRCRRASDCRAEYAAFSGGRDVSRLVLDVTNLTDRPQTLNIALAASGLLELLSQQPQPVNLAPGVRTTLFVPVRALEGFGEGEIQATISGLNLPGETLGAQHKQWQIGVRPAWPAQTVNSGIALAPERAGMYQSSIWQTSRQPRYRDNCC